MSDIEFGKEQALLQDIATRFFREKWTIEEVREHLETEAGYDSGIWGEAVEAGWTGMVVPEEYGGLGLGMTELVAIVEPMGRHLFASPFVPSQLVIQGLLGRRAELRKRGAARDLVGETGGRRSRLVGTDRSDRRLESRKVRLSGRRGQRHDPPVGRKEVRSRRAARRCVSGQCGSRRNARGCRSRARTACLTEPSRARS